MKKPSLLYLFFNILKINAFTFGGGYTIIPVIRDEIVLKNPLISEEDMSEIVALAQSSPGPMAVNCSLLTGYRLRGPLGAIVAMIASVLPCLIIISLMFYVYTAVSKNPWVKSALSVMGGVVSAVLIITTIDMARNALKKHTIFGIILMLGAFVASFLFKINTGFIILFSGLISLILFSFIREENLK